MSYDIATIPFDAVKKEGRIIAFPVASGVKICKGAFVGFYQSVADNLQDIEGMLFLGVAANTVDNSYGVSGAINVLVDTFGDFFMKNCTDEDGENIFDPYDKCVIAYADFNTTDGNNNKVRKTPIGNYPCKVGLALEIAPSGNEVRIRVDNYACIEKCTIPEETLAENMDRNTF